MCQQPAGGEFSCYREQQAISGGRRHIIKLLSSQSEALVDRAISRNQMLSVQSLNVLINAHQATPGCPPDAELLIRQPCIIHVETFAVVYEKARPSWSPRCHKSSTFLGLTIVV